MNDEMDYIEDHWRKLLDNGLRKVIDQVFDKSKPLMQELYDIHKLGMIGPIDYGHYYYNDKKFIQFRFYFDYHEFFGLTINTKDGTLYSINPLSAIDGYHTEEELSEKEYMKFFEQDHKIPNLNLKI